MNFPAIIFVGIMFAGALASVSNYQDAATTTPANKSVDTPQSDATPPAQAQPATPSSEQEAPPAKPVRKKPAAKSKSTAKTHPKKPATSNCNNASDASGSQPASGSAAPQPSAPSDSASSTAGGAKTGTSTNCPPSKIIVQQGGTSEPSIQLVPGGSQGSGQRDTANQMLGTAEANLKKISEQRLSTNQRDMVTQIRQYIEQSKAAQDDGDLERARTLAWKAQLLSQELVKPPQ